MGYTIKTTLFFLLLLLNVHASTLEDRILKILRAHDFSPSHLGVLLWDMDADTSCVSINPDTYFIPASVQKLITTAAALDTLGPQHRFTTKLFVDSLEKSEGIARGTTVIQAEGDPHITAENLWLLVTQLHRRGLRKIEDTLIIQSAFTDTTRYGPGFENSNSSRAYMAPNAALSANFNALEIHITPTVAGEEAHISFLPRRDDIRIRGRIMTREKTSSRIDVSTYREDGQTTLFVNGMVQEGGSHRVFYRKIWDPEDHFFSSFKAMADEAGIVVTAQLLRDTVQGEPDTQSLFYTHSSRPLSYHAQNTLKYSNNFIAELIFRSISAETGGDGSWEDAGDKITAWWANTFDTSTTGTPRIFNGSGMGIENRATPAQIGTLLRYIYTNTHWNYEFITGLAVSGRDGTLSGRLNSPLLSGNIRAKTGTLAQRGVNNVAGFFTINSTPHAFVLFLNNSQKGSYAHWNLQTDLLEAVSEHLTREQTEPLDSISTPSQQEH
ncbi:MAG: D-alanyl-D-alanine carboxypeptidase/D-alanyl-D-alanine endopeptidase [Fibrobacterota bacterium]